MSVLQELFSDVTEDLDDYEDDDFYDIPEPELDDDWQESWLEGIDPEDVEGYSSDGEYWEV